MICFSKPISEKITILFFIIMGLLFSGKNGYAQNKDSLDFKNAVNLGAFLVFGNIQLNYERMVAEQHGLLGEVYYVFGNDTEDPWYTLGVSYRYHFKKTMKGGFANVFYRFGDIRNYQEIEEGSSTVKYELQTNLNVIGAGLGYRWQWDNGFNALIRAGYGYQINAAYTWAPNEPADINRKNSTEALQGMDLEFSVGYSF